MFDRTTVAPVIPSHLFLSNSDNRPFIEGKSQRIAGPGRGLLILAFVLLIATIGLAYLGISDWLTAQELNRRGILTNGTVIDRSESSDDDGSSYYVKYHFFPVGSEGVTFVHEQHVSWDTYTRLQNGSQVSISYLPENPDVNHLGGADADSTSANSSLWILLLPGLMLIVAVNMVRRVWRYRRLMREGGVIFGELTRCSSEKVEDDSGESYRVAYSYKFPVSHNHDLHSTKYVCMSAYWFARWSAPANGTPVAVLYVNDKLFEML